MTFWSSSFFLSIKKISAAVTAAVLIALAVWKLVEIIAVAIENLPQAGRRVGTIVARFFRCIGCLFASAYNCLRSTLCEANAANKVNTA